MARILHPNAEKAKLCLNLHTVKTLYDISQDLDDTGSGFYDPAESEKLRPDSEARIKR